MIVRAGTPVRHALGVQASRLHNVRAGRPYAMHTVRRRLACTMYGRDARTPCTRCAGVSPAQSTGGTPVRHALGAQASRLHNVRAVTPVRHANGVREPHFPLSPFHFLLAFFLNKAQNIER